MDTMTREELAIEFAAAIIEAEVDGPSAFAAKLPPGCHVVCKSGPWTYLVKTPDDVIVADISELRYAWGS